MNFSDLQKTWSSPINCPAPAELERQKIVLARALARRRRRFIAFLAPPALALILVTGLLVWRISAAGALSFSLSREWAAPLLLALPWLAFVHLVRRHLQHLRHHPDYQNSIAASLRALLDANRQSQARFKTLIWLHLASAPILALVLRQLVAAGKTRPHELTSMIVFFGTVILLALLSLLLVHFCKLRPEQKQIQALLRHYENDREAVSSPC